MLTPEEAEMTPCQLLSYAEKKLREDHQKKLIDGSTLKRGLCSIKEIKKWKKDLEQSKAAMDEIEKMYPKNSS